MEAFTIASPGDIDAAVAAAGAPDTKFIAGGTDLMQLMRDFVERPKRLVDLEKLPLDTIEITDQGARIGALARMSDVADDPELRQRYPVVAEALLASASPQVRNMATIGGNLLQRTRCGYFRDPGFPCNKRLPGSGCPAIPGDNRLLAILGGSDHCIATHPSDLAVALLALDASLELHGPGGARTVKLADFHLLPGDTPERETVLAPGEMITAVTIPSAAGMRSHYLKVRDRASFEFALVSAAVVVALDGDRIRTARIAMGGVGTKPWRLPAVEAALAGVPATQESFAAAAARAAEGAQPRSENAFKVPLMQRALVRALTIATA
ncbi:MAG: xanthine dehydrogenase family protein subunit M [Alphaproteobacteria bacterium]|nr:xanthine dehydrogenase family protein subunit M [Alphaproteobacteria bacterium]